MNIFDFFGSAVCHQMVERSFLWGNMQSPLCARCTGIEASVFFGVLFLLVKKRRNGNEPFSLSCAILIAISFLPLAWDGVGSYLGFWESNNFCRVLTGAMAGYGLPALFLLCANFQPGEIHDQPIFQHIWEPLGLLAGALLYGILTWAGILPYFLVALVSSLGVICIYGCFWYLFLRLLGGKRRIPYFCFSLLGAVLTIFLLGGLRLWIQ